MYKLEVLKKQKKTVLSDYKKLSDKLETDLKQSNLMYIDLNQYILKKNQLDIRLSKIDYLISYYLLKLD